MRPKCIQKWEWSNDRLCTAVLCLLYLIGIAKPLLIKGMLYRLTRERSAVRVCYSPPTFKTWKLTLSGIFYVFTNFLRQIKKHKYGRFLKYVQKCVQDLRKINFVHKICRLNFGLIEAMRAYIHRCAHGLVSQKLLCLLRSCSAGNKKWCCRMSQVMIAYRRQAVFL